MTEPTTPNIGLIIPNTGDLSGTWGSAALNPDYIAIDGYQAGVVAVAASGTITLTSPAGFTATPSQGPTQSQNALIRLSGVLAGNVTVTFPLPGYYIVENLCTNTANFYVQLLSGGAGNAIGAVPGKKCHVFNDGISMDYVNMPDPGTAYDLHGAIAYPPWMNACTVKPYLIKDGAQYPTATYPSLFALVGYTFGGSGANFNVPDELARARIAYDTVGTGRLTTAVSGVNGQTMASAGGSQSMQQHSHSVSGTFVSSQGKVPSYDTNFSFNAVAGGPSYAGIVFANGQNPYIGNITGSVSGTAANTGSGSSQNVQPSIISFLPLIKT